MIYSIIKTTTSEDKIIPINEQILPALEVLKLEGEYNSGDSIYNFLSLLANTNPIMPQINPIIPRQKEPTIEIMPSTRAVVALGRFCCALKLYEGPKRSFCSIAVILMVGK